MIKNKLSNKKSQIDQINSFKINIKIEFDYKLIFTVV